MKNPVALLKTVPAAVLLLVHIHSTAQREAPKAVDIKAASAASTAAVFNPKGTPAKIKDTYGIWTDFNLRTKADADKLRQQIGSTLFEEIANNCNETSGWPGAISSYAERNKVRDQMVKYVCYQIAEVDDKWILRVPAAENSFLPYGVRPDHDIFFMVRKTDVELTGAPSNVAKSNVLYSSLSSGSSSGVSASSTSSYYSKAEPAKINATGGMYSTFNLESDSKAAYLKGYWGTVDFENVAKYCREENWPSGIKTLSERDKVRQLMNSYKAYKIAGFDGKYILRIPADENKFMPYNMQSSRDFFFVINQSDVTLTVSTSSSSASATKVTTAPAKAPVGFAAQLNALLEEYLDDFDNLKGKQRPKDVVNSWDCTVQLAGSKETYIEEGFLSDGNEAVAEFGKFKDKAGADAKFKEVYNKMNASEIECCEFKVEKVSKANYESYIWKPVDGSDITEYGYEVIMITLENNKRFDEWDVSLRISSEY